MKTPATETLMRGTLVLERVRGIVKGLLGDNEAWEIEVIRCDDLLNVYAASATMSLTRPFACGIYANVVYLVWINPTDGYERFTVLIPPQEIENAWGSQKVHVCKIEDDRIVTYYGSFYRDMSPEKNKISKIWTKKLSDKDFGCVVQEG